LYGCFGLNSTQRSERSPTGLILTFRVAGLDEIKRWVLSFGREMEVL
jgi:hypothetical protein